MTSFVLRSFDLPPIEHEKKKTKCSNNNKVYPKSNNIMFDSRVCRGSTLKPDAVFRQQNALKLLELERDKKGHRRKKNLSPVKGRVHVCVQTDETLCDILKDNLYDVYYLDDETELREIELDFGEHANQETEFTSNNEIVNSIGDINECEHLDKCPINVSCIAQALVDKIEEKAIDAYFQKSLSHRQRAR